MANELNNLVDAVAVLLDEMPQYKQVHKHEPDTISTSCEVAIIQDLGTQGQYGVQQHEEVHTLRIRTYILVGADIEYPEQLLRQVFNLLVDKFNAHVTLNDAATISRITRYLTGYLNLGGVLCRIMDVFLEATIVVNTTYA